MKDRYWLLQFSARSGLLLIVGLLSWAPVVTAQGNGNGTTQACSATPSTSSITPPVNVSVSSVAYGPIGDPFGISITFTCKNAVYAGQVNQFAIVAQPGAGAINDPTYGLLFPTGVGSIYLQLVALPPASQLATPKSALINIVKGDPATTVQFQAQYVKLGTSPISSGTLSVAGTIVSFYNTDDYSSSGSSSYGFVTMPSSTTLTAVSCTATSPTVMLPTVSMGALASASATAGRTPFAITVSGCPTGAQVAISLSGTPPTSMPAASGIARSTGSDANVAVQILDGGTLAPVDISGTQTKSLGSAQSGVPLISRYYAQYYAVRPAAGGTVAAQLTYTLSYP
jgi:major type 1 subunit fimbrin (pilin)